MAAKYTGGCDHVHTQSDNEPVDNHICHCSVCKRVTGQASTHVVFFKHGDLQVDNLAGLSRQPFNSQNPSGPLELCTCSTCGKPIMLDDKQRRIRVILPGRHLLDGAGNNLIRFLASNRHEAVTEPSGETA